MLEEHPLSATTHDRAAFDCGVPALNEYLQRFALQQSKKGITAVHVLVDSRAPSVILGYYTLSAAQIDVDQLSPEQQRKLPRYPLPCFRMGRLAASADHHGRGIGKLLVGCAVDRCLQARKQVAAYALIVDAKDERAKSFYLHYGFVALRDHPLTLFLGLGS
ncbi:MAG: GNAT family N-acetyltransferase [Betaproteobacteria bacterium]|nr:MAG: GNAT family N-acetyltransferase [Betaproteobacteria bacterium]